MSIRLSVDSVCFFKFVNHLQAVWVRAAVYCFSQLLFSFFVCELRYYIKEDPNLKDDYKTQTNRDSYI